MHKGDPQEVPEKRPPSDCVESPGFLAGLSCRHLKNGDPSGNAHCATTLTMIYYYKDLYISSYLRKLSSERSIAVAVVCLELW